MKRIENSCQGKHPYESKEKANEAAAHLNELGGRRVKTYRCKVCGNVHVGHEAKGRLMQRHKKNQKVDYVHVPGVHKVKFDKND